MRTPIGALILGSVMILLDTYVFQALKAIADGASPRAKMIIYTIYWSLSALALIGFLFFVFGNPEVMGKRFRTYFFATLVGLFFAKLVAAFFFLADDLRRAIQWIFIKLFSKPAAATVATGEGISRSAFLSWLGFAAGGTLFGSLLYGFGNKYRYEVKRQQLAFENLPAAFKGLKIIHISDIHSGSFSDKKAVLHGVEKIMAENADLILFTGDIVNDRATEMHEYMDVFEKLNAPLGVFSTLGNHDYGDYVSWPHKGVSKEQNLENLKAIHASMGWRLLMNEHVVLEKDGHEIALLGIENWSSKARFPKHGRMDLAHPGTEKYAFKILMSHDPSHWEAEVQTQYPDIDLMLSGHTHGMQFGVEIPGLKWSPVQYMYKQWAGLYENGKQKLYVNRGFGFIGYPGRVGILPEITVIELV
ncbi:MAG: metallophosphoesterase [Ferruginibacter sp.]